MFAYLLNVRSPHKSVKDSFASYSENCLREYDIFMSLSIDANQGKINKFDFPPFGSYSLYLISFRTLSLTKEHNGDTNVGQPNRVISNQYKWV